MARRYSVTPDTRRSPGPQCTGPQQAKSGHKSWAKPHRNVTSWTDGWANGLVSSGQAFQPQATNIVPAHTTLPLTEPSRVSVTHHWAWYSPLWQPVAVCVGVTVTCRVCLLADYPVTYRVTSLRTTNTHTAGSSYLDCRFVPCTPWWHTPPPPLQLPSPQWPRLTEHNGLVLLTWGTLS